MTMLGLYEHWRGRCPRYGHQKARSAQVICKDSEASGFGDVVCRLHFQRQAEANYFLHLVHFSPSKVIGI